MLVQLGWQMASINNLTIKRQSLATEKQKNYILKLHRNDNPHYECLSDEELKEKLDIDFDSMTKHEASVIIDSFMKRLSATDKQIDFTLDLYKQSNLHYNCLSDEELKEKLNIDFDSMTRYQISAIIDSLQKRINKRRGGIRH